MRKIDFKSIVLTVLLAIAVYFALYLVANQVIGVFSRSKVPLFPKVTNINKEIFPKKSLSEISNGLTFFNSDKAPFSTFTNYKNKSAILVYTLDTLNFNKPLSERVKVLISDKMVSSSGIFKNVVRTKYFEFKDGLLKSRDSSGIKMYIDGKLELKPLITDSMLFYSIRLNSLKAISNKKSNTLFYATKTFFFNENIPFQLLIFKRNKKMYMVILYPKNKINSKLEKDYLFKLIFGKENNPIALKQ